MRTSSLIGHVVEALDIVLPGLQPADKVVKDFFRSRHYLGSSDRRFIAERIFAVLRHHRLLEVLCREALLQLRSASLPGAVPPVMLLAAHEICKAGRRSDELETELDGMWRMRLEIPPGEFIRALPGVEIPEALRSDPATRLAVEHSLPDFVVHDWIEKYGSTEAEELCRASNGSPPVTIRVNTLRGSVDECQRILQAEGIASSATHLSSVGLTLPKRINAQALHSFRQGWFEMQDEGSQLLASLLEVRPGMSVLDACAGAGGKSLHLAALMHNKGKIIALDVDGKKLENFNLRARRAGVTIAQTSVVPLEAQGPAGASLDSDAVLIDAPCSGVGTFRRNPGAKLRCTAEYSRSLARTQAALLERYAASVKAGGRLVYATCTLVPGENEEVVESFLRNHGEFSSVSAEEVLKRLQVAWTGHSSYLELLPHRTGTDGYFAAVLQRKS
ncbi:MAG TPA: RsmB/NOP family class I SAM-dependent RNA methyltransferase [Bacteroidota bacterium]|nr:RsmB/NOP family class I SAM-dependent RNA methyltransferase [Bacteroidota bacterium]